MLWTEILAGACQVLIFILLTYMQADRNSLPLRLHVRLYTYYVGSNFLASGECKKCCFNLTYRVTCKSLLATNTSDGRKNDQLYEWVTNLNRPTSCWKLCKETDVGHMSWTYQHSMTLITRPVATLWPTCFLQLVWPSLKLSMDGIPNWRSTRTTLVANMPINNACDVHNDTLSR